MADIDVGGLLGTIVVAGIATKMTQSIFGDTQGKGGKISRKKIGKKGLTSTKVFYGGTSPF